MRRHLTFGAIDHLIWSFFHQFVDFFRMPHFIADLAVLLGFSHLVAAGAEIEIFRPFV